MKERLKYIDTLKGFAILFVIYFHLLLRIPYKESTTATVFEALCMPLFFFISGKFANRLNRPTSKNNEVIRIFLDKILYLFIPSLLCFAIAIISTNSDFNYWVVQENKLGYWFTYVLFLLFVLHALLCQMLKAVHLTSHQWFILPILGLSLHLLQHNIYQHDSFSILQILSLKSVMNYYIFFAIGTILPYIPDRIISAINSKYVILLATIVAFYTGELEFLSRDGIGWHFHNLYSLVRSLCLILVVYIFFKNSSFLNSNNKVSQILQLFGRQSLIIYYIHFYFLFRIPYLRSMIDMVLATEGVIGEESAFGIELIFCLPAACTIAVICIVVGNILCQSSLIARFLFGQKK